jgi:hypothetical protein
VSQPQTTQTPQLVGCDHEHRPYRRGGGVGRDWRPGHLRRISPSGQSVALEGGHGTHGRGLGHLDSLGSVLAATVAETDGCGGIPGGHNGELVAIG